MPGIRYLERTPGTGFAQRQKETGVIGDREVIVFHDERMLGHRPDVREPFLPGRLDRRVREILAGLGVNLYLSVGKKLHW